MGKRLGRESQDKFGGTGKDLVGVEMREKSQVMFQVNFYRICLEEICTKCDHHGEADLVT